MCFAIRVFFVAPPNHHLFVVKCGSLELSPSSAEKVHHARPSAEPLFASVAAVYKRNAIAVVLTGGDGDGSLGVQVIKKRAARSSLKIDPRHKILACRRLRSKTGDVDFILPLNENSF